MEECIVCTEKIEECLPCGHLVHLGCVIRSFKAECPVCRRAVPVRCVGIRPSAEPLSDELITAIYQSEIEPEFDLPERNMATFFLELAGRVFPGIIQTGSVEVDYEEDSEEKDREDREDGEEKELGTDPEDEEKNLNDIERELEGEELDEEMTDPEDEEPYQNSDGYLYREEDPNYDEENPTGDEVDY